MFAGSNLASAQTLNDNVMSKIYFRLTVIQDIGSLREKLVYIV